MIILFFIFFILDIILGSLIVQSAVVNPTGNGLDLRCAQG
jgi:hypothetical protein